jgi:hypothetical protein
VIHIQETQPIEEPEAIADMDLSTNIQDIAFTMEEVLALDLNKKEVTVLRKILNEVLKKRGLRKR